jgi:NAD(P)-dependent dehydrogenase (short-subunit alcohol dehydrogenase family)
MTQLLSGRTALVTGSSRGIGCAIAQRLAAEGAAVVVTARSLQPSPSVRGGAATALPGTIAETVELIEEAGGKALAITTDLEDAEQRERLIDEVVARTGRLDILVNNAGYADYSLVENMSVETFDRTVEHYLKTPFVLTKAAVPHMRKQEAGWIVNIGSVTGIAPIRPYRDYNKTAGDVVYASMKAALHRFTQGVARCQHRRQLRWPLHGGTHCRCSAADSRHFPDRTRRVPGRNRPRNVSSACCGAYRAGGFQLALLVDAGNAGAQPRRQDAVASVGTAGDGQSECPSRRAVAIHRMCSAARHFRLQDTHVADGDVNCELPVSDSPAIGRPYQLVEVNADRLVGG